MRATVIILTFILFLCVCARGGLYKDIELHKDTNDALCSTVLVISDKKYPILHETLQRWISITPNCTKIIVKPLLPSSIESRQKVQEIADNNERVTIIESVPWEWSYHLFNRSLQYTEESAQYIVFIDGALYPFDNFTVSILVSGLLEHPDIPMAVGACVEGTHDNAKTNDVFLDVLVTKFSQRGHKIEKILHDRMGGIPIQSNKFTNIIRQLQKAIPNPPVPVTTKSLNDFIQVVRRKDLEKGLYWYDPRAYQTNALDSGMWFTSQLNTNPEFAYYTQAVLFEPRSISQLLVGDKIKTENIPYVVWRESEQVYRESIFYFEAKWASEHVGLKKSEMYARLNLEPVKKFLTNGTGKDLTHKPFIQTRDPLFRYMQLDEYLKLGNTYPLINNQLIFSLIYLSHYSLGQFQYTIDGANFNTSTQGNLQNWDILNSFFVENYYSASLRDLTRAKARDPTDGKPISKLSIQFQMGLDPSNFNFTAYNFTSVMNGDYVPLDLIAIGKEAYAKPPPREHYDWLECKVFSSLPSNVLYEKLMNEASMIFRALSSKNYIFYFRKGTSKLLWSEWIAATFANVNNSWYSCSSANLTLPLQTGYDDSIELIFWAIDPVKIYKERDPGNIIKTKPSSTPAIAPSTKQNFRRRRSEL